MIKKIILTLFFLTIPIVKADEGVVYNKIECYGITYGYHNDHWHEAIQNEEELIAKGDAIYSYPCSEENNPSLATLTVNGNNVEINDKMEFQTYDETASIQITPVNPDVTITYENSINLEIGDNKLPITALTKGGITKTYELNIIRQKVLSNNSKISQITINGKQYKFKDNVIEELFLTSNINALNIEVETEDETSQITIKDSENLKSGDNTITIICKAEDGSATKYYINYHKTTPLTDILGLIIGLIILSSPIIIILIIIIYKKKKRYINSGNIYKKPIKLFFKKRI